MNSGAPVYGESYTTEIFEAEFGEIFDVPFDHFRTVLGFAEMACIVITWECPS